MGSFILEIKSFALWSDLQMKNTYILKQTEIPSKVRANTINGNVTNFRKFPASSRQGIQLSGSEECPTLPELPRVRSL